MSARFNVATATRDELVDLVRRLHGKVSDVQGELRAAHAASQQQAEEMLRLQKALAAADPASQRGALGAFFDKVSGATGSSPPQSAARSHNNNNSEAGPDDSVISEFAASRIASLESELESERARHREDVEVMQQQVDMLSIRAADDAEAMERLRACVDAMRVQALVQQNQQQQQQQQQQHANFGSASQGGTSSSSSAVTSAAALASMEEALAALTDERDAARLATSRAEDQVALLQLAVADLRSARAASEERAAARDTESLRLRAEITKLSGARDPARQRARAKYDRLYARFVLWRTRLEDHSAGTVSGGDASTAPDAGKRPLQQRGSQVAAATMTATRTTPLDGAARPSRRPSSSSSCSSSRSRSSDHEEGVARGRRGSSVAAGAPRTPPPAAVARRAVVVPASHLHHDDDDDNEDENDGDHGHADGRHRGGYAIASDINVRGSAPAPRTPTAATTAAAALAVVAMIAVAAETDKISVVDAVAQTAPRAPDEDRPRAAVAAAVQRHESDTQTIAHASCLDGTAQTAPMPVCADAHAQTMHARAQDAQLQVVATVANSASQTPVRATEYAAATRPGGSSAGGAATTSPPSSSPALVAVAKETQCAPTATDSRASSTDQPPAVATASVSVQCGVVDTGSVVGHGENPSTSLSTTAAASGPSESAIVGRGVMFDHDINMLTTWNREEARILAQMLRHR